MSSHLKRFRRKRPEGIAALITTALVLGVPAAPHALPNPRTLPRTLATSQVPQTAQTTVSATSSSEYQDIIPTPQPNPPTSPEKAKALGSTALRGLAVVAAGLKDCSDLCPPLKTAAAVITTIYKIYDGVSTNNEELVALEKRLNSILSLVERYKEAGGLNALEERVQSFSTAIEHLVEAVQDLQGRSLATRVAEISDDVGKIQGTTRNLNSACDLFLIDIQLHTNVNVQNMLQLLNSRSIDKLRPESVSYKTRRSAYGEPRGCMPGTRVNVLEMLEAWASDEQGAKVYWFVGMAGTGKSTIAQSLCELLEKRQMLGASFFCSRASEKASNPRLIIPSVAYSLAKTSPTLNVEVVKVLEKDPDLIESNDLKEQFQKLICGPLRTVVGDRPRVYKIVVIDALDECTNPDFVYRLIQLILSAASGLPLKFFLVSRADHLIPAAFDSSHGSHDTFLLHEIEKDIVESDIRLYMKESLMEIKRIWNPISEDGWPPESELSQIVKDSGKLFVYASTSQRYIREGRRNYKQRLTSLAKRTRSRHQTSAIDDLYGDIVKQACDPRDEDELSQMETLVLFVIFLRRPLSLKALSALSKIPEPETHLSLLSSVIHIPSEENAPVSSFHASFPEFLVDPERCPPKRFSPFTPLLPAHGHAVLALRCLELMNGSLKYNICEVPEEMTVTRMDSTNPPEDPSKIPEALKYACVYWADHLSEVQSSDQLVIAPLIEALRKFLETHLFHWMECLSVVHELRTGIYSLLNASAALTSIPATDTEDLQLFVDDACRFLRMGFEGIQQYCFMVYQCAFTWIPKKSLLRQVYGTQVKQGPKVILGLPDSWGPMELCIGGPSQVCSVGFSNNDSQLVSGWADGKVRIWDARTGEVEATFEGHDTAVTSVAFSHDNTRAVSGSTDQTIRIWNVRTGEVEATFKGHADFVASVAFSHDDMRVVSGSIDQMIKIWNARTGEVEATFEGHTLWVSSVAFSHDDTRVVSGSHDKTIRIWNARTGEVEATFEGHTNWVTCVAFSHDSTRVVSGSHDHTIRIWNVRTGEVEATFEGHTDSVISVAFSHDNTRVVSGSWDRTIRIWNARTGKVMATFKGHTSSVVSVAFSHDDTRVVSGSHDQTIGIWNARLGEIEATFEDHTNGVTCVAFSHDNTRVVAGSTDRMMRIWNARTGEVEATFEGHTKPVSSVAFSHDNTRVVSGSNDQTIRIWNVGTGEVEATFEGHTLWVTCVAFSHDDTRVVSGSNDQTIRIWNARTGEVEATFKGHTNWVTCVAFSHDDMRVVSGSDDQTARVWNARTGKVEAAFEGHNTFVRSVAFSCDDTRVVSGSDGQKVWVWNARTGEVEATFECHTESVISVAFPHDDSQVISSQSGIVRIRDLVSKAPNLLSKDSHVELPHLSHTSLSFSHDRHWVLGAACHCWIPLPYRAIASNAYSGDKACFGYGSGLVVILNVSPV